MKYFLIISQSRKIVSYTLLRPDVAAKLPSSEEKKNVNSLLARNLKFQNYRSKKKEIKKTKKKKTKKTERPNILSNQDLRSFYVLL